MAALTLRQVTLEKLQPGKYYLLNLKSGTVSQARWTIDYCRREGDSDGGGIGFISWYWHNIDSVYELPGGDE